MQKAEPAPCSLPELRLLQGSVSDRRFSQIDQKRKKSERKRDGRQGKRGEADKEGIELGGDVAKIVKSSKLKVKS
jgi:hypothetical protein